MSQSLSSIYLHAVFSTKERQPFLVDSRFRKEVFAYIAEVSKRVNCPPVEVGGFDDHVHVLVRFGKTISVADWMKEIKRVSSGFVRERNPEFAWQTGYAVFSHNASDVEVVRDYIRNQEEHHRVVNYQVELRKLMSEHGIEWDEKYFWD